MKKPTVVTECDIFATVAGDNVEISSQELKQNALTILDRLPFNIFKDEYSIMYKYLKWCKGTGLVMTQEPLQQFMINTAEDILASPKVTLHSEIQDEDSRMLKIVETTLVTLNAISFDTVDSDNLAGNLELFIEFYYKEELKQLVYEESVILDRGLKIGNKVFKGAEDMLAYSTTKRDYLNKIKTRQGMELSPELDTDDFNGDASALLDFIDEQESLGNNKVCMSGIDTLDKTIGCFNKKELAIVQAGSGVGKSRMAVQIASNAVREGQNVLFISLEQVTTRVMPMFMAHHVRWIAERQNTDVEGLTDRDIIFKKYNTAQKKVCLGATQDLLNNPDYGRLKVVSLNVLMVNEIEDTLASIWENGFQFDCVVLDYFGLLSVPQGQQTYDGLRRAADILKSLCKTFKGEGFFALVVSQISKQAEKDLAGGDIHSSKLGGADTVNLLRGADYCFTLYDTEEMRAMNQMRLVVNKIRLGSPVTDTIDVVVEKGYSYFRQDIMEDERTSFFGGGSRDQSC